MSPEAMSSLSVALASPSRNGSVEALPVTNRLRWAYIASLAIVLFTAVAAITGVFFPSDIYPTTELAETFVPNDAVTLLFGLPVILLCMWLTRRGSLVGLLFWPGAIFYGLYNYLAYLLGMPFNMMYPIYLLIVTVSIYTLLGLLFSLDGKALRTQLHGRASEKLTGGVLCGFGLLFLLRTLGEMSVSLSDQVLLAGPDLALLVADFVTVFAWVIGGVLLWRKQAFGYVVGYGLLCQAAMLFFGLLILLLLQPVLTTAPLMIDAVVAIGVMGLACFIPFILVWLRLRLV